MTPRRKMVAKEYDLVKIAVPGYEPVQRLRQVRRIPRASRASQGRRRRGAAAP